MNHLTRREFIQLTATAVGGVMLTGCGDGGGGKAAIIADVCHSEEHYGAGL